MRWRARPTSSAPTASRTDPVPVLDASVCVDALAVAGPVGDAARAELRNHALLEVPSVFAAEATSALRGMVRRGDLSQVRAAAAIEQLRTVRALQYPFEPFIDRVWQLRDNLTVYDAWYVALAEWLATDLVTTDRRLIEAPGLRCHVRPPG